MGVLHIPDAGRIQRAGYPAVIGVPVVFLEGHRYLRELNRYIRYRSLGDWHPTRLPRIVREAFGQDIRPYAQKSMITLARHLMNFIEWTEWADINWKNVEYHRHLLQGYQRDMQIGRWSAIDVGLAPTTINQRMAAACHFLTWAGSNGYREPFRQTRIALRPSRPHPRNDSYRLGRVRQDPRDLRLPTAQEIALWLKQVEARFGRTKALLCRTVLETAVRRDEAVEWRVSYLPENPENWEMRGEFVIVRLVHGTKFGVPRIIRIRTPFAQALNRYQTRGRLRARAMWIAHNQNRRPPSRLFLSEQQGAPISYQSFYEAWVGVPLPYKGWSPHAGRHYWACTTLLEHLAIQARRAQLLLGQMPSAWVHEVGMTAIQTIIRPQLGHANEETSDRYLKWIHESMAMSDAYLGYHQYLEECAHHVGGCNDGA